MIRRVQEADFEIINTWRRRRGAPLIPVDLYPPNGFIDDELAAGFLTLTDTSMGIMEHFVSNPDSYAIEREEAIIEIIEKLFEIAHDYRVKWILAATDNPRVESYILKMGGKLLPGNLYGKEL